MDEEMRQPGGGLVLGNGVQWRLSGVDRFDILAACLDESKIQKLSHLLVDIPH